MTDLQLQDSEWIPAAPAPYPCGLIEWTILMLKGWRDSHGQKPELVWPWQW